MKALTIDMGMTWVSATAIIAAALQDGNEKGRETARAELLGMARAADLAREAHTALRELVELKAIKRKIDAKVATQGERSKYKSRKEAAWQAAEAVVAKVKS